MNSRIYSFVYGFFVILSLTFTGCSGFKLADSSNLKASSNGSSQVTYGQARFTVISPEVVRMEYSDKSVFIDAPTLFASERNERFLEACITQSDNELVIDTGKLTLTYRPDGKTFHDGNLSAVIRFGSGATREWKPSFKNQQNLGGTIQTLDRTVKATAIEDGLIARDGWHLLDDSKGHIIVDDWVQPRPQGAGVDWFLFGYGNDYKSALVALTKVSGKVPLPRKYMMGSWYSWYWPFSSNDYRNLVQEYRKHDFPLDGLVIDMDWHREGWTGYSWNTELFPDREKIFESLHEQGIRVTFNDHPSDGVRRHEDMWTAFMKDMGKNPDTDEPIPFDTTNRTYMDTFFKHTHAPLEDAGMDFWWLDWQQETFARGIPDLKNLPWLNRYYFKNSMRKGLRGQNLSRWGGWGDHKHPVHFSGDAGTEFPMLTFQVPFTSTAGNMGLFYWSHDIGGYGGPRNEEVVARWTQFGAMSPVLRLHSARHPLLDRRPWSHAAEAQDSMRKSFHLRSELFPYIYSTAWQGYHDALPLLRPMYIEYPHNEEAYRNPQQYLFGDALIVAPITTDGIGPGKLARQSVWFPDGQWYNYFTGEKVTGDTKRLVSAPLDEFPLFVKGGVPVVMQPYTERMASAPLSTLRIRSYPGVEGHTSQSVLYEDDGVTQDWLNGLRAITRIRYLREGSTVTVTVDPTEGSFKGQVENRNLIFEFPVTQKAIGFESSHGETSVEYSESEQTNKITLVGVPIRERVVVRIQLEEYSSQWLSQKALKKNLAALLGEAAAQEPLSQLISKYSAHSQAEGTAEKKILEALLGLGNVGVELRSVGIHIFPETKTSLSVFTGSDLFNPSEGLPALTFRVADASSQQTGELLHQTCENSHRYCHYSLAEVQSPQNEVLGVNTTRTVQYDLKIGGQTLKLSNQLDQSHSFITEWNVIGPFKAQAFNDMSATTYGPETATSPTGSFQNGLGHQVSWQSAVTRKDGIVDLTFISPSDTLDKMAYGMTYLQTDTEQTITLDLTADEKMELFLDGQRIYLSNDFRGITEVRDRVTVTLKPGKHVLVAKVVNWQAAWGFGIKVNANQPIIQSK